MKSLFNTEYYRYVLVHTLLLLSSSIIGFFLGGVVGNIGNVPFLKKPYYDYFFHNALSSFLLIGVGIISYGILTWIPLVYNGAILGMAISFLSYYHSYGEIVKYFAHAFFEIPALMVAIYLGRSLPIEIKKYIIACIRNKSVKCINMTILKKVLKIVIIMLALLLIASVIEAIPKKI